MSEKIKCIQEAFVHSQCKSTRDTSGELKIPHSKVHVLCKHFKFHPYKLQILQQIMLKDEVMHKEFAMTMLDRVCMFLYSTEDGD